jgi:IS1 family transposase
MISREPRQIQAFRIIRGRSAEHVQAMFDEAPMPLKYCSDGYLSYLDVVYPADYVRNCRDKADSHNVESVNADILCFIAGFSRRSRCFFRSIETMEAVIDAWVAAYNKFGEYKLKYRQPTIHRPPDVAQKHLHHYKDLPLHIIDFLYVI